MSITCLDLIKPAFRIAGITDRPGRTPATDQTTEGIAILNRMIGSWNCDRLKISGISIDAYDLVADQKVYTIGGPGLGADFDATRPAKITHANIIINTTDPVTRSPVKVLNDDEWGRIRVQDVPGTIPKKIYYDGGFPLANIYVWGQALTTYQLELFTWQSLDKFAALTDIVQLPDGYELAINYNLARLVAAQFPTQAKPLSSEALTIARESLYAIESLNAPSPVMRCDRAVLGGRRGGGFNYQTGE